MSNSPKITEGRQGLILIVTSLVLAGEWVRREFDSRQGRGLVLFSVPSIYEVDAKYRRRAENSIADPTQRCLDSAPGYERLRRGAAALGVELADLLPEFRRMSRDQGTNLFRRSDQHWNEAGHKIAARMVGETLLRSGLGNGPVRLYGR